MSASNEQVGPRRAICLGCRTALLPGERCDLDHGGDHPVVSLVGADREALVSATWGPPAVRERNRRLAVRARNAAVGIKIAGLVLGVTVPLFLLIWLGMTSILGAVGAVGALVCTLAFSRVAGGALRRGAAFSPVAPPVTPLLGPGATGLGRGGLIRGERMLVSPATATACIGYAVELRLTGQGGGAERVMYRDAVTGGFDVELDEGEVARVPPGRLRLLAPMRRATAFGNMEVEGHLAAFDRQHGSSQADQGADTRAFDPLRYDIAYESALIFNSFGHDLLHNPELAFSPFRYDLVYEQLLLDGDRVELLSPFEPAVDPRAHPTHYRQAPTSLLVPRGVPVLQLQDREPRS